MNSIELYTDGASRGNPGKGGYGIVLKYMNHRKEFSKAFKHTTNNRMELLAVIDGLQSITNAELPIVVYSDSKYVVDAVNKKWLNGWQTKRFAKVKNPDLWQQMISLLQKYKVTFVWVKGHASNPENNRCDELATMAADNGPYNSDSFFENLKSNDMF